MIMFCSFERAAYTSILASDDGFDRGALRALDRLVYEDLYQVLDKSWSNITPSVTKAQNVVELITMAQGNMRFGPEDSELYQLLCRRLEQPVRVPVQVATSTPIYGYLRVLKVLHYYRMWLHNLVHHQAAIHQLRLLMEQLPKGTDAHLDHSFQAVLQGLLQEAKRSDGSRSDVQEVINQCLERCSDLEFRGSLAYDPQSSKSATDAAFVARTAHGGGGNGHDSGARKEVCFQWRDKGRCPRGDGCPFEHVQRGQPGGTKPDPKNILCSHFQLHGSCRDRRCLFKHSQSEQPASNLPPEPAPVDRRRRPWSHRGACWQGCFSNCSWLSVEGQVLSWVDVYRGRRRFV
jgi:hypothetical protein